VSCLDRRSAEVTYTRIPCPSWVVECRVTVMAGSRLLETLYPSWGTRLLESIINRRYQVVASSMMGVGVVREKKLPPDSRLHESEVWQG
jgi:hypothetical protein